MNWRAADIVWKMSNFLNNVGAARPSHNDYYLAFALYRVSSIGMEYYESKSSVDLNFGVVYEHL